MKKRGFFLTTDAFIAIAIMIFGVILFVSTISVIPYKPQVIFFAQDVVEVLGGTKIYEINDDLAGATYLEEYRNNGEINDFQNTVFGQDLFFIYKEEKKGCSNCIEMAQNMTEEILVNLIADEYSINVSIYVEDLGTTYTLYEKTHTNTAGVSHTIQSSDLVFSSKQLIVEEINDTFVAMGIAEVIVWQ